MTKRDWERVSQALPAAFEAFTAVPEALPASSEALTDPYGAIGGSLTIVFM